MKNARSHDMARRLSESGGAFHYGRDLSRLLVLVVRSLATGRPVTEAQVQEIVEDLGLIPNEAHEFLRRKAERDPSDNIVGLMGLSLKEHPHRFLVGDIQMATWCAQDTLFLPSVLKQAAMVESESPVSKETVRVTVGPESVRTVTPSDAVVSMPILELGRDMTSAPAVWTNFCHHVFFFASREEAEKWSEKREDMEILSVDEAFELGQELCSAVLPYA